MAGVGSAWVGSSPLRAVALFSEAEEDELGEVLGPRWGGR